MTVINVLIESLLALGDTNTTKTHSLIRDLVTEGNIHSNKSWAAHMTSPVDESALLGKLIAGMHNGNLLSAEYYPQLVKVERQLIDWFCQLFQHKHGHFTHGSTYANLEALWQAREHNSTEAKTVYGSTVAHYSIAKACRILGLNFKGIKTNARGEMSLAELKRACKNELPLAIVATAGTSSCGAIDPITACVALAKDFSCWCHIDAAWGGALMLTNEAHLISGLIDANSVSFDPHKALNQPRPCSLLLYQQPLESISDIDYLEIPPKETLLGSYGGELFLPLWCSLLLTGEVALVDQLNVRLKQSKKFYLTLKEQTDWWLNYSPTGIVCFMPSRPYDLSNLIQQGILSHATINDRCVYRAIFSSNSTQASSLVTAIESYF